MAKILIVDDDDFFRIMLEEMVTREGHQVCAVKNGKEALNALNDTPVDLIITDILMPEMDGIELIIELSRQNSKVPIIAISGGRRSISPEFNLESAQMMGVRATLAKPFTRSSLRQTITNVLAESTNYKI